MIKSFQWSAECKFTVIVVISDQLWSAVIGVHCQNPNSLFKIRFRKNATPKRGTQTFSFYFYSKFRWRQRPTEVKWKILPELSFLWFLLCWASAEAPGGTQTFLFLFLFRILMAAAANGGTQTFYSKFGRIDYSGYDSVPVIVMRKSCH